MDTAANPLDATPVNALTGQPYSGGNEPTLVIAMADRGYRDPRFLTFRQALELGRVVRKGEKAAAFIRKVVPVGGRDAEADNQKGKRRQTIRGYAVFNYEQTVELQAAEPVSEVA